MDRPKQVRSHGVHVSHEQTSLSKQKAREKNREARRLCGASLLFAKQRTLDPPRAASVLPEQIPDAIKCSATAMKSS
jgi:hypothetical protein